MQALEWKIRDGQEERGCNVRVDCSERLQAFLAAVKTDPFIGPAHISLYIALLGFAMDHDFRRPLYLFARQLMDTAKISGAATYHKCMKDLIRLGYVNYRPSHNRFLGSEFGLG